MAPAIRSLSSQVATIESRTYCSSGPCREASPTSAADGIVTARIFISLPPAPSRDEDIFDQVEAIQIDDHAGVAIPVTRVRVPDHLVESDSTASANFQLSVVLVLGG